MILVQFIFIDGEPIWVITEPGLQNQACDRSFRKLKASSLFTAALGSMHYDHVAYHVPPYPVLGYSTNVYLRK